MSVRDEGQILCDGDNQKTKKTKQSMSVWDEWQILCPPSTVLTALTVFEHQSRSEGPEAWPDITGSQIIIMASLYFWLLKSSQKMANFILLLLLFSLRAIRATFSTFIDTISFPDCVKVVVKLIYLVYPKCVVLYFVQAVFVRFHSDTLIHAYPSIFWKR